MVTRVTGSQITISHNSQTTTANSTTILTQGLSHPSATGNNITFDSSGRNFTPNQVMFYARKASGSNDVTGTFTAQFDTKIFDIGNGFNTSTGVYTAPVAGNYYFSLCAFNDYGSAGRIDWEKNGTVVGRFGREYSLNGYICMEGSIIIDMAVNDTIEGEVTSGQMHINSGYNYFSGFLIG